MLSTFSGLSFMGSIPVSLFNTSPSLIEKILLHIPAQTDRRSEQPLATDQHCRPAEAVLTYEIGQPDLWKLLDQMSQKKLWAKVLGCDKSSVLLQAHLEWCELYPLWKENIWTWIKLKRTIFAMTYSQGLSGSVRSSQTSNLCISLFMSSFVFYYSCRILNKLRNM